MDNAKWIGFITDKAVGAGEQKAQFGAPASYLVKQFWLDGEVSSASLDITSLGIYKSYINGLETDDEYLNPLWSDYNKRIEYQTFDVTALLKKGANSIGAVLGDGWYTGNIAIYGRKLYGANPLGLWLRLKVDFADGTSKVIVSDNKFRANTGAIRQNDLLNGEHVDARLCVGNFTLPQYDISTWHNVDILPDKSSLLSPSIVPGVKCNIELTPVFLHQKPSGKYIFDFMQNMVGNICAKVKGERGAEVKFRYGEMLNTDGTLYTDNLRSALATDYYICSGKDSEEFSPLFTFHGFRYLEVSFTGNVEVMDIKGKVLYNAIKETSEFSCSDDVVTKVYQNALWGQRGNFVGTPTDCPQRDERMGWTGDAQVFSTSAMYNMDCRKFFDKYLQDILDAQREDGAITDVVPFVPVVAAGCAGWGDVITILPYNYYMMYGDAALVKKALPAARRWIGYLLKESQDYIRPATGYGDWLSVGEDTDKSVLATAFFAHSAYLTAKMCEICGEDSDYYHDLSGQIKDAFRAKFVDADNVILSDTQCCYLLAKEFGILPDEALKPHLIRTLKRKDNHLSTGFLGVKYLLPALCDLDLCDLAYDLMSKRSYPSWGYSVVNGATTIWERWNSYTVENGFADITMNSFNHYSLGSCTEWMFAYALGIRPQEPGFTKTRVAPCVDFSGKVTHCSGSYASINGKIEVSWKVTGDKCSIDIYFSGSTQVTEDLSRYDVLELTKGGGHISAVVAAKKQRVL